MKASRGILILILVAMLMAVFVGPAGAPLASWLPGIECASAFQYRGRRLHYLDLDMQECRFADPALRPHRAPRRGGLLAVAVAVELNRQMLGD